MKQLDEYTNEQLLSEVLGGNCTAFNEIYLRYRLKVLHHAHRFTRSMEEAEELTQDVFVRLWENRSKIDLSKNFEAFLFTLIRNSFLETLRKQARATIYNNRYKKEEPLCNSVEDYIDFKECQQITAYGIENLSPQVKIAYLLSREQGRSHEYISRQMGISKNTVNNHLKQSLKILRKCFKVYSPETILSLTIMLFW
ncbi:RNA polymerase sigma-70 factor (family 1) [Mucilaginibacter sp. UYNi724]